MQSHEIMGGRSAGAPKNPLRDPTRARSDQMRASRCAVPELQRSAACRSAAAIRSPTASTAHGAGHGAARRRCCAPPSPCACCTGPRVSPNGRQSCTTPALPASPERRRRGNVSGPEHRPLHRSTCGYTSTKCNSHSHTPHTESITRATGDATTPPSPPRSASSSAASASSAPCPVNGSRTWHMPIVGGRGRSRRPSPRASARVGCSGWRSTG